MIDSNGLHPPLPPFREENFRSRLDPPLDERDKEDQRTTTSEQST